MKQIIKWLMITLILICLSFTQNKLGSKLNSDTNNTIQEASIFLDNDGNWTIVMEKSNTTTIVAYAKYTIGLESIGWDLLAITTNKNFEDEIQAEGAGRLEGYLTRTRIWDHYRNMNSQANWHNSEIHMPQDLKDFFIQQEAYIIEMYNKDKQNDIFANAYYLVKQLNGLIDEYNKNSPAEQFIIPAEFHVMSSFGDIFDAKYYNKNITRPDFNNMNLEQLENHILGNNHCSAIFKAKEDFTDLFFGHNSWYVYSAMTRIFKEYNFNFNLASIKSRNILFSSYPATLGSMDDFYVTSQDLVVIETTNSFFGTELYEKLTPRSLLSWQRAMIANRISSTSQEWTENFSKFNSGTYNNMFMALDMKKIDLEKTKINNGALVIVEQVPGTMEITDVTEYLRYGYWPSYNVPFNKNIKSLSKIQEKIDKEPLAAHSLDYDTCARANIFRRDQHKANSVESFKKLIRYNDWKNDPFSLNDPTKTIAARGDFRGKCLGAYDAKMSSVSRAKGKNKIISIIMGPSNDKQNEFTWGASDSCKSDSRYGLPSSYNFQWYDYKNEFIDSVIYPESLNYLE